MRRDLHFVLKWIDGSFMTGSMWQKIIIAGLAAGLFSSMIVFFALISLTQTTMPVTLIITGIVFILSTIAPISISTYLLYPVFVLSDAFEEVSKGNFDLKLETDRHDEFNNIAENLNSILHKFKNISEESNHMTDRIKQDNERLKRLAAHADLFLTRTSIDVLDKLIGVSEVIKAFIEGDFGVISEKQRSALSVSVSGLDRALFFLSDLRDYALWQTNNIRLDIKLINLKNAVDFLFAYSSQLIGNKKLHLLNNVDAGIRINSDENRFRQILFNLLEHAIVSSETGNISISAIYDDRLCRIILEYPAEIFPPEEINALTESFRGADMLEPDKSIKNFSLKITGKLVELLGGRIWVKSTSTRNSWIIFSLHSESFHTEDDPQAVEDIQNYLSILKTVDIEDPNPPVDSHPDFPELKGSRILVVDDEPVNLQALTGHLKSVECETLTALNSRQAFEYINEQHPELVIIDDRLHQQSGFTLCREIRNRYARHELPVLMISTENQMSNIIEGFACGINDFLIKPVNRQEFLARLQGLLDLKRGVK